MTGPHDDDIDAIVRRRFLEPRSVNAEDGVRDRIEHGRLLIENLNGALPFFKRRHVIRDWVLMAWTVLAFLVGVSFGISLEQMK